MKTHPLDDLIGSAEISTLAGVTAQTISVWAQRHEDFPTPLLRFRSGPIYSRKEVEEWLVKTGRLDSPRPKAGRSFVD